MTSKVANIKNETWLTGNACSMQDKGSNDGKSIELEESQPLLSRRLSGLDRPSAPLQALRPK